MREGGRRRVRERESVVASGKWRGIAKPCDINPSSLTSHTSLVSTVLRFRNFSRVNSKLVPQRFKESHLGRQ